MMEIDSRNYFTEFMGSLDGTKLTSKFHLTLKMLTLQYFEAVSLQAAYQNSTNKLRRLRLAWFGGCDTAQTSSTYENLLDMCNGLGAEAAVGFMNEVYLQQLSYFAEKVILYYGMDPNNTINAGIISALADKYHANMESVGCIQ